jgi:hypothetical protein
MGILTKKTKPDIFPCIVIDHKKNYRNVTYHREGEFLTNKMKDKMYAIVEGPIWIHEGKKRVQGFLVDEQKGCTIRLERNKEDFLEIRTDPLLLGTVIGSRLVKEAFDIRTSLKTLMVVGIGCIAVGFFFGLIF